MPGIIRKQAIPMLNLPSWAVDDNILSQIENLVQNVIIETGDENQQGATTIKNVRAMRDYIKTGIFQIDP